MFIEPVTPPIPTGLTENKSPNVVELTWRSGNAKIRDSSTIPVHASYSMISSLGSESMMATDSILTLTMRATRSMM